MIPVATIGTNAVPIRLETFVYRPTGHGPFPVMILSHGSPAGDPKVSLPAHTLATYFVRQGFAVMVPMRRGRGQSTGYSREYEERHCDQAAWAPGLRDAMDDLSAAVEYAGSRREMDTTHIVLAGVSRGGFLSVAYAAEGRHRSSIAGVINFVGAWIAQREDRCPEDFNSLSFAKFGGETHVPTLWLYGESDPFNTSSAIRSYVARFRSAGGNVEFVLFPRVPGNGHAVANTPALWADTVERFLRQRWAGRLSPSRMPSNER